MSLFLVTNGCGFIGLHLVDALCAQHHIVRILDDLSIGSSYYCLKGAELVVGDVTDPGLVDNSVRDVDGCFHPAAVASIERGNMDRPGTQGPI